MKENMKAIIFLIADYINIRHRRFKSQMKTGIYQAVEFSFKNEKSTVNVKKRKNRS